MTKKIYEDDPLARVSKARLERLRAVEELYLNGYKAREIYNLLSSRERGTYDVTYGTIRNDIVMVRKLWGHDIQNGGLEGRERYLASLKAMRRKVMTGWLEEGPDGRKRRAGRDYRLAHQIDKEIARIEGVEIASDTHKIHLDITAARSFMDKVMEAIFEEIDDPELQARIVAKLEASGAGGE